MVIANATVAQVANASAAFATVCVMYDEAFRRTRLADAVAKFGSKAALGRALGHSSGAFVRQMIAGERPITEKTIAAIEHLHTMRGWFSSAGSVTAAEPSPPLDVDDVRHVDLPLAIEILGESLEAAMADDLRDDIADALAKLARRRGHERDQQHVLYLLQSQEGQQKKTGT